MCGVVGLIGEEKAGQKLYPALFALQHRGQDAAGILSYDFERSQFHLEKDLGLVEDVFTSERQLRLKGSMALGHTRYSTIGTVDKEDLQPLFLSYPYGIGMIHNGNVTNYDEVVDYLRNRKLRWTFSRNDLEILLHMTAIGLASRKETGELAKNLSESIRELLQQVQGAYSAIGMLADQGLFAFCDSHGIRPLLLGRKKNGDKYSYCFASEKQVFFGLGFEYFRDLRPGELVFIDKDLNLHSFLLSEKKARPCMFEWIYFAGSETEWHGRPVYEVRLNLGRILAEEVQKKGLDVDVVAPVPDTSRAAACRLAEVLEKPYREVLIKNRYVQRSFIVNQPELRKMMVNLKLSPVESEIRGKKILLVDDSIVRGTTSARIIRLLREAGAEKVYLASTCPPIRHPCFYGIDFPDGESLVAHKKSEDEIAKVLEVDGLVFLPLQRLQEGLGLSNLCSACLDGDYPVPVATEKFLKTRHHNIGGDGKSEVPL
ncbi:amidophosphoribosyltransferase [Bdellovibrio bacteriovorus]|uniref:Amidophosphoribosyltransferase n=1 Tax=Bdellovibrio bacteriovorus TaxID=959 RepID=A0A150WGJ8_BDEBC|nr:amidophosphoribosyltransferase [Bdellovibrio bacteriovorus]KYG62005.1 amidophosphoribosyltransferase [Bdellovibrio bacteriovorus]